MKQQSSSAPLSFAVYWGCDTSNEASAQEVSFQTRPEYDAYLKGMNEAGDSFEAHFVANGAIYVNRDEDFVERRGASTETSPMKRHVIWGEDPEPGTRAETYEFETEAEAIAFQKGAEDFVGWSTYSFVPSADFKPYESFDKALDAIPEEGKKAMLRYLSTQCEAGDNGLAEEKLVFVRDDGAFVHEHWELGDHIENRLLSLDEWVASFDEQLQSVYGVRLGDVGLDDQAIESMYRGSERTVHGAVGDYAEKSGLHPSNVQRSPSF